MKTSTIKRFSPLPASLLLSLFLAQSAAAQSAEGPFFGKQALINYWATASQGSTWATRVYLNGYQTFFASGFGPASEHFYFQCQDGLIRSNCNSLTGPFFPTYTAQDSINSFVGASNTPYTFIYQDGSLIQVGFGPAFGRFYLKTCYADRNYVVLDSAWTVYGSISGIACLPRL
ncbi:hypothetical protein [Hyalangium gracile]|uniref:hypothetical protein n=1 Tax=Hyalangium gracile TaxID=394092 RepID=UPI001CCA104C|nr:hypothetical protein [Hyalangium gracile]